MRIFNPKIPQILIGALLLCVTISVEVNAEMDVRGFLDTYQAVRTESPNDYLGSRTRIRVETQFSNDQAGAFVSVNAVQNNIVTSESGLNLMESYLDYTGDNWDIRAGKQIIIWGKADGLQITDIISPKDYSEFLARDFDDMRLAVDAFKVRVLGDISDLELIWIPIFKAAVTPTTESPWTAQGQNVNTNVSVTYNETVSPEKNLQNSEFAAKYSLYLSGVDLGFSLFNTWNDLPTMHKTVNGTNVVYSPEYHRLSFGALEFSIPVDDFVLRGEIAGFKGRYYETDGTNGEQFLEKDSIDSFLGLDWSPGSNWSFSVQIMGSIILDYEEQLTKDEQSYTATLNLSKKLFREKLNLSTMYYYSLNDEDSFNRSSFDYAMTDELHVLAGFDVFSGTSDGSYGQYDNNDELWFKLKYSF